MLLFEKIDTDLKAAIKEKDPARLSALRLLKTAISHKMIELKVDKLGDSDVIALIKRDVKKHLDSIGQFGKGGRDDLVKKEKAELEVLKSYLPEEVSPEEIKEAVKRVIDDVKASGKKDFGKVMKLVMEKFRGAADGKIVSSIVNELLGNSQ